MYVCLTNNNEGNCFLTLLAETELAIIFGYPDNCPNGHYPERHNPEEHNPE